MGPTRYYRIMLWPAVKKDSRKWRRHTLTKEPAFFVTDEELDVHALFDEGIAVKQYDELPDWIEPTKL